MTNTARTEQSHAVPAAGCFGHITAIFLQGLIAILPLVVTIAIVYWLGVTAERKLGTAIKWALPDDWYVRGMGIASGITVIFLVGVMMNIYGVPKLIRSSVNQRTDAYGGSLDNRLRMFGEAVDALLDVLPADRIGVRLTPIGGVGGS